MNWKLSKYSKWGKMIGCLAKKCWVACINLIIMIKAIKAMINSLRVKSKNIPMNNSMKLMSKTYHKIAKS